MAELNLSEVIPNVTGVKIEEDTYRAWGIVTSTISLIGIPGNILVIISVLIKKQLRTVPNFLVLNLSVCDLLFLGLALPYHACCYLTGQVCIQELCWLEALLTNWLLGASVLCTAAIAVNRYIAIVLSRKYRHLNGTKAVIVMCLVVYIIPFTLISLLFNGSLGTFGYNELRRVCGWEDADLVRTIVIIFVGICPLVFMTACYAHILVVVVASRKKVGVVGRETNITIPRRRFEAKLSLMLAMVYVVYLITTFPSFLLNVLDKTGVYVSLTVSDSMFILVWTSAAINPIVYGLVNKKYREAYKVIFTKIAMPFKRSGGTTIESNIT